MLTTYNARVYTPVAKLKRMIAAGQVRYAYLSTFCGHKASSVNAACSAPVVWIREHGTDVSSEAGLPQHRTALPAAGGQALSERPGQRRAGAGRAPAAQAAAGAPELIERAHAAGRLALDTEFMGEGRYRTLLCLIQLAAPEQDDGGESIALVDPLREDVELEPLAAALADPPVRIVVHAGRQDIALLRRELRCEVTNIFDTQIAAGFAGLAAQASYDSLLTDVLGLRVAKTASFTRWDARPAVGRAARLRARGRRAPARARGGARRAAGGARAARLGARGVPRAQHASATSATRRRSSNGCRGWAA